jgi:alkaline phosphatase
MARGNQPLFAQERRNSATSEERAAREDDALLGNQRGESELKAHTRAGFWQEVGLFIWAVLATATVIVLAVVLQHQGRSPAQNGKIKKPNVTGKRNLIFMVSDGSTQTFIRSFNLNQHANLGLL